MENSKTLEFGMLGLIKMATILIGLWKSWYTRGGKI